MSDLKIDNPEIVEADAVDLSDGRGAGGRGTVITLTTVIALLIATALTVLGLGAADTAVGNFDASSWLWSSAKGEVDRVNGETARVDTRAKITDAQNHEVQITQNDKYLILRDLETGQVTALDLTTLQVSATMPSTPGLGVTVALHGDTAMIIDALQGQVRQIDPRTLAPIGTPIALPRGIVSGGFDTKGLLWIGVPAEGTVVAIKPGTGGAGPTVVNTIAAAGPDHDLVLSSLDSGVAVLDNTEQRLIIVTDRTTSVDLPITRPGIMPEHTVGSPIVVTVPDVRQVVLVDGTTVTKLTVPGTGTIGAAVAYAGRVYVPDPGNRVVRVLADGGKPQDDIKISSPTGAIEMEVRENFLFINSPDGSEARVVDPKNVVHPVDKFQDGVLGGDPPPPPPAPPTPPVNVPGAPQAVVAVGGDGTATITWRKANDGGAPILYYWVEGGGQKIKAGATSRRQTVEGLTNGTTYTFTVQAVNERGGGPKAKSNPVTPSRDVPDPPASVTAVENPDGTVDVTWPAANGQGRRITQYQVTATSGAGGSASVGAVQGTTLTIPDGALDYGTQYTFTVVAINDGNIASQESDPSNVVRPFKAPGAPKNLSAATTPDQAGAITVTWTAADSNGRPITRYEVERPDGTVVNVGTATSTTVTGLGDDVVVAVRVRAVNQAGAGPDAVANARTMGLPTITVTAQNTDYNSVGLTFTPNNRGGNATCTFAIQGGGQASQACTTAALTLSVGGLWPNNTYNYTLTITNPAGSEQVTGSLTSPTMRFTHYCTPQPSYGTNCNGGVWAYRTPSQNGTGAASLSSGENYAAECWTTGDATINAIPWGMKQDNRWIRFQKNGTAYFPWAWAYLDGGDNINRLPAC
jgi:hypothetical protein